MQPIAVYLDRTPVVVVAGVLDELKVRTNLHIAAGLDTEVEFLNPLLHSLNESH